MKSSLLFVDDMILYLEDLREATRKLLYLIIKVKLQDMKSILKRKLCLSMSKSTLRERN